MPSDDSGSESGRDSDLGGNSGDPPTLVEHFFRHQYAQLVANLTGRLGTRHWTLAEDAVQTALNRALHTWPRRGIPKDPAAWLFRVAGNAAIDTLRRETRQQELPALEYEAQSAATRESAEFDQIQDDLLRMIFFICDPAVPKESQIALALKTLCGFGTGEIARALLTSEASVAKRITRAKQKLRELGVQPRDFELKKLAVRLPAVLSVIYLLFNEGYSSSLAQQCIREELCEEAVRLAHILAQHPATAGSQTAAFLSLLLFHACRLDARIDDHGGLLLISEQDRTNWDRKLMSHAFHWFGRANKSGPVTRYHAEAWIAAEHCRASCLDETNWDAIVGAYDLLCRLSPSPIHQLSRAIAISRRDGTQAGMKALDEIDAHRLHNHYYLWHATWGEFQQQQGKHEQAVASLQTAWQLAPTMAEKELISRKIDALSPSE